MKFWNLGRKQLGMVILSLLVATAPAEGAAVSGPNAKMELFTGSVNGADTDAFAGSLSTPIGSRLGLQLDSAYGEVGTNNQLKGVGLHLFARDPQSWLLGALVSHAELENIDLNRFALEGERYAGPFTVAGRVGHRRGDLKSAFFGSLDLRWYPLEELMVEAGLSVSGEDDFRARVGAEYQALAGLAFFADLAAGDRDYDHFLLGGRYYFGSRKSLLRRHREDDPVNVIVSGILRNLGGIETR